MKAAFHTFDSPEGGPLQCETTLSSHALEMSLGSDKYNHEYNIVFSVAQDQHSYSSFTLNDLTFIVNLNCSHILYSLSDATGFSTLAPNAFSFSQFLVFSFLRHFNAEHS